MFNALFSLSDLVCEISPLQEIRNSVLLIFGINEILNMQILYFRYMVLILLSTCLNHSLQ